MYNKDLDFRYAKREDTALILQFIKELAGYGKAILKRLAAIAVERGCGRLEWWCLDWNKSSIDFYLSLGAEPMSDWTVYRITGDTLTSLAK